MTGPVGAYSPWFPCRARLLRILVNVALPERPNALRRTGVEPTTLGMGATLVPITLAV